MRGPTAVFLLTCLWGSAALAEPGDAARASAVPSEMVTAAGPTLLTPGEMGAIHAGDEATATVLTGQQLSATSSGNTVTANSVTSGSVNFSQDALSGFSGIGNFVINTGANNSLQGAINVTIVTTPVTP